MTNTTLPQTGYLTVKEVADALRMSRMTVYRMLAAGDIPSIRIGTRSYRIPAEAFSRYLAGLEGKRPVPVPVIPGQQELTP